MPAKVTSIRIDEDLKNQASDLFRTLGLDLSSAVNIFLCQCVLRQAIPFEVGIPKTSGQDNIKED